MIFLQSVNLRLNVICQVNFFLHSQLSVKNEKPSGTKQSQRRWRQNVSVLLKIWIEGRVLTLILDIYTMSHDLAFVWRNFTHHSQVVKDSDLVTKHSYEESSPLTIKFRQTLFWSVVFPMYTYRYIRQRLL